ncbi:MAG: peptide deformylase [Candidatus Hydrogenedentota bacterium]
MAILNVTLYPDEPLVSVADPIPSVTPKIMKLANDMFDTMLEYEGVGLAAPQVGVSKRIFVLCEPEQAQQMCLINPVIMESDGREVGEEGCLSLPSIYAEVPRAARLRVQAINEKGEHLDFRAKGLLARIIQHELDHLNGVIFLDRVDLLTRQDKLTEWEACRQRHFETVKER